MILGERYTQAQGVQAGSLSREGYEGWRIEKSLLQEKTSAGKNYVLGLKIINMIGKGHIPFTEREVRRRKALNLEMDALGMTDAEFGSIRNNPDAVEAWVIQKKTRNSKQKLHAKSILLLRH